MANWADTARMRSTFALLTVAAGLLLTGCGSAAVAAAPTAAPAPVKVKVNLHVFSGLNNTQVRYTCDVGKLCGPDTLNETTTWAHVVELPVGSVVRIAITAPDSGRVLPGMQPKCVIADSSDRVTLVEASNTCALELR